MSSISIPAFPFVWGLKKLVHALLRKPWIKAEISRLPDDRRIARVRLFIGNCTGMKMQVVRVESRGCGRAFFAIPKIVGGNPMPSQWEDYPNFTDREIQAGDIEKTELFFIAEQLGNAKFSLKPNHGMAGCSEYVLIVE